VRFRDLPPLARHGSKRTLSTKMIRVLIRKFLDSTRLWPGPVGVAVQSRGAGEHIDPMIS